ncbi:hypothetical protein AQI95_38700 [Streptomyces yokosukanensis]|uniref:Transposase DDE domain-containing protein n=1 Tax=Streptomyces yokosukanensis TaxID=67386 RepID=A0A101NU84_9ACTN|nr:hypothetical protein AQI95_38700 [Streptomyces yokosukanensis]
MKSLKVHLARKGTDSGERLGRRRLDIERTISWLSGYRRPDHRYGHHPDDHLAFLGLTAARCSHERLRRLTMWGTFPGRVRWVAWVQSPVTWPSIGICVCWKGCCRGSTDRDTAVAL